MDVTLKNILKLLPGHIYWKDRDGFFLGCNDKQAQSYGLEKAEDMIGRTDADLLSPKIAKDIKKNDAQIMETKELKIMEEVTQINGKKSVFLSHKAPLVEQDGSVIGVLGVSIDISKQKEYEEKITRQNLELSNALESKSEFLRNVSHEIRIPLHSTMAITRELYDQWESLDAATCRDLIKDCLVSQNRLMTFINSLLDLSKYKSGKMNFNFENNDLQFIVKEVKDEFRYLASITLDVDKDANTRALCDIERIKQVVRNLITNAIKFSEGKEVKILIHNDSKGFVNVSVSDKGVGIPENELTLIFETFEQSSRTKTKAGGTGLGLAICRDIVMAHKGKVWAKNNEDIGATFCFTLPNADMNL